MLRSACLLALVATAVLGAGPPPRARLVPPDRACELSSCYPATGNLLIGREARLHASSTCGLHRPELYCIVSHLEDRKKCFWCDSTNRTINQPEKNHRIQNVIYKYFPGTKTKSWWQSENGKENVFIQLDMEAEFHFTHLIIHFKTFRPKAMLVERSFDFGKTWLVYRYFAHNCDDAFPGVPKHSQRTLSEVVCEERYSGVAPSTDGEVILKVLPPNINVTNPYSEEVQFLLRMTNLRINFTQLHTLGDDLLDDRPEIEEKYYYAINEMTVRGSCSCYGHASRCLPMPGVESKHNMVHGRCECTHYTRGLNCEYCDDFYNDLPWQPAVGKTSNACKRCTCNNHATSCHFDAAVFNKTGKISGGVCDNCLHNTMGINCERCMPKFYRDPNLDIQSPEVCKPCDCDPQGTTDQEILCDDETDLVSNKTAGRCMCKTNVDGLRCDKCKEGFWNFNPDNPDGCEECTCNALGTVNERGCDPRTGNCICKRHVIGVQCDQCLPEFYGLSESVDGCSPCDCDPGGALDNSCDVISGQCKCRPNVTGLKCDRPIQNFFVAPPDTYVFEGELAQCDSQIDDNAIQSQLCLFVQRESNPDERGHSWTGPGFMRMPEGSTLVFVVDDIKKSMHYNVIIRYEPQSPSDWEEATIMIQRSSPPDPDSPCANIRIDEDTIQTRLPANQRSVLVVPSICLEKDKRTEIRIYLGRQNRASSNSRASILIDSIVLVPDVNDVDFLAPGTHAREEFDRYNCHDMYYYDINRENMPEVCKKYHASIGFLIRNGTDPCQCDPTGSKSFTCDDHTGLCNCVENVVGARCDRCTPGTYGFSKFGCKRCDCNSIGSLHNFCDETSGLCKCRANTYGRACNLCTPGYFNFPNCQQCDCNGHASECDDRTGACTDCRDNTEGHRCERCTEGFYGDPRLGADIPCRPCPCPGVVGDPEKSNHADRCELDLETKDVVCYCKEGYAGPNCDVCADNYFGDPIRGTCEKCECSNNVDITKPGNCDPKTGQCLQCLYHTSGDHCDVCEEGYYGNALERNCQKCNCSQLGTNFTRGNCDPFTGQCPCFPNVEGENCDKCTENHWRIALGKGCDHCECDPIGSVSQQCNPYTGKCNCNPGHGGRQCDQCQENYWGDPNVECHECECDLYGSISRQCRREDGSCVCKPGMGGYKCDECARGYLGEVPQCFACGECFDNWDSIINDLRTQTEYTIGNASKIKLVGATGAYTRDFEEMTKNLSEVEKILDSAKLGRATIEELFSNVTALQQKLSDAEQKVKESNENLNTVTSKINLGNVTLDGLRAGIENLKAKTLDLSNNATKLQEANLEGALNLTREAKRRALQAADDAENVQTVIADTDRQIKNTDRVIDNQYTNFNNSQNEIDKRLHDLQEQLSQLDGQLPKLNEKTCGHESDNCDICGGAGCGKCGGISCDQGAVTKADQALDFANKTERKIKEHELAAEDLYRSISQVKLDTVAVKARSKDLYNKAFEFKSNAERVTNDSQELTAALKQFLSNTSNTPADVRTLANDILGLSISVEPEEITELSQRINSTVSQLTNIENIITETKPDLERAKALNQDASRISGSANETLEKANVVLKALEDAQLAQNAAEIAIAKANDDIEAAKSDLIPIAKETEQAQKKANETKEEVEGLRTRLSNLQKDVLKIESDAEQVKQEANDVVNRAEGAEQKARQLRQDFKQTNMSLAERASQTSNSRERAQLLLKRATKLASDTQMQLSLLTNMKELYNDHNEQLNALQKGIDDLNTEMAYYLSEITKQADYYRTCTTWLYLEPILSNDEGELGVKFRKVDQAFRQATRILEGDPRLSALIQSTRLQPLLDSISEQLQACQSALNQYIDEKRSVFPRFYFLCDDDLLELLGQARAGSEGREAVMQTHLKKLFPGITGVQSGPNGMSITALCSGSEQLALTRPVDVECAVEAWLKNLETEMRSSLRNLTLNCLTSNSAQAQDPFSLPTQVLCLAQNIRFTEQAEKAIGSKQLHRLKEDIDKEYAYYAAAEVDNEVERSKRQALILQCVCYINVIRTLIEGHVSSTTDWLWLKQLRFYLTPGKEVVARMGLAEIPYSYEYLGVNTGQFVRTELADQCFLILTQSLHLGLVGNPFGPAGTGKTESVKALGALVGRLVLVFNCDEAMDAQCMGRLLTGLALCGSWGCFDELNRLSESTLANVSHQLAGLLAAGDNGHTTTLNGNQIKVSPWCGVAATMNPAGRGYGGRRTLPAALERLLRPIAMVTPEGRELATHLLQAGCVSDADKIASDLCDVFTMASGLLSSARHYDWGLRALKAAVGSCVSALRNANCADLKARRAVARKCLALNNRSKLTQHDADRFESILSMVFADVPEENSVADSITTALEAAADNLGLISNKQQVQKCKEVYEQLQQRMGVVIVGLPQTGKTVIRSLLKAALIQCGHNIVEYTIHPKAMARSWLLGQVDPDTRQWTDGVISATAVQVSNQPLDVWSWIVCDGDIDPEWIEALNSVLDDNRLLTLPSGWRVQFGSNVNFIFETHSLEHASPATISRMGIILLGEENSCVSEYLDSRVQNLDIEEAYKMAVPLLHNATRKCVQWMQDHKTSALVKIHNTTLVSQILTQFTYISQSAVGAVHTSVEETVFLAIQRSLAGLLKESALTELYDCLSDLLGPPPSDLLTSQQWVSDSLYVSSRLSAVEPMVAACVTTQSHLLIIGPEASAKYALAEHVLRESNEILITIDCTPILEPRDIILELQRNNVVRTGAAGARGNDRVTLLVRSLHRAYVDDWGSSPVHALLRQLMSTGGFWQRGGSGDEAVQWCACARLRVVATATTRGIPMSPRLYARMPVLLLTEPDSEELLELSKSYLEQNIGKHFEAKEINSLASNILSMFTEINEAFDSRPQLQWHADHMRRWCQNVKWYSANNSIDLYAAVAAEAKSIFRDRLVTADERTIFNTISRKYLKDSAEDVYHTTKLLGDGVYLEGMGRQQWEQSMQKILNQCLSENESSVLGESGMEVCDEFSVLVPAIARATSGGICVVIGSRGVGRREAARLVATSMPATYYEVVSTDYTSTFKQAVTTASEGTKSILVLSESACSVAARSVAARSVAALSCVEAIVKANAAHDIPKGVAPSQQAQDIMPNIKQNLGILVCLDKAQENLPELLEKFPLLYNEAHLVWLDSWSERTLREMPGLIIQRLRKENASEDDNQKEPVPVEGFLSIYNSLDDVLMKPPCRYVNLVKSYYRILCRKRTTLAHRQKVLSAGVEALRRARTEVATLQAEAGQQELALSEKQLKANQALDQISATVRATTDKKEEMHVLKRNIELENDKLQKRKQEIELELASVEPVIAAARAAVGDIRPEALSEVRSLRAPPDVVRDVLEGVLRLMGVNDTSWHSMKSFLARRGVKEDIRNLDASQISEEALQSVRALLQRRSESFTERAAKRASAACAPLAAWVRANLEYGTALARVTPLQQHQRALLRNLEEAENQLAALSSGLATVDERVASLKEQLGQHTRDAATIELKLSQAKETIRAANSLIDQLANEYDTWEADLANISKEISELSVRSLLASAYVVYLPDLTEPQAREYISRWGSLIGFEDPSFSVINFLAPAETQLKWEADQLPTDLTAIKNAIVIDQYLQSKIGFTPLIIDPEGDALGWLRTTLASFNADFVSLHSDKYLTALQYAVRLGRVLVICDVDQLDGGCALALHSNARVIVHTRVTSLTSRLAPHRAATLSVLHFTPSEDSLTDLLVHYALQHQNPDVNEKAKEIKIKKAVLQKQQHELQENLLEVLSSNVDILHDAYLLASLNNARDTNTTITEALSAARAIDADTRLACERYRASAYKVALASLAVKGLSTKHPLVVVPTDTVMDIYVDAVRRAESEANINSEAVVRFSVRRVAERVLLAVHKRDKYPVLVHLLRTVHCDVITDALWQLFTGSDLVEDKSTCDAIRRDHPWVGANCVSKLALVKDTNEELFTKLSLHELCWQEFNNTGDCNALSKLKLDAFETVVAVAAVKPDSLYRAVVAFVDLMLGAGAVHGSEGVAAAARWGGLRDGKPRPILLLGSHAADLLAAHASSLVQVGISEGPAAWQAGVERSRGGGWLAILVGASPFTQDLVHFIVSLTEGSSAAYSNEFRLWIVSEDRPVPPALATRCINVVIEAVEGVKHNVLSTLSTWARYESSERNVRMHVCVALFHALLQERRAYIPQGWSRWYSWEWGEVVCMERVLRASSNLALGRELAHHLYAARVSQEPDRRLLQTLLHECLGEHALGANWAPRQVAPPLPYAKNIQAYMSSFAAWPELDPPQLLGLPANCRAAWERAAAATLLIDLKELRASDISRRVVSCSSMRSVLALWKKMMAGSPLLKPDYANDMVQQVGSGWWTGAAACEAREAARIARHVHATLAQHARHNASDHHHVYKVCDSWQTMWAGDDAPDVYLREFCRRARYAHSRLETRDIRDGDIPQELDLSTWLVPARALCALRAHAAARSRMPVHALTLRAQWGDQGPVLEHSVSVCGLQLVGAVWTPRGLEPAARAAPPHEPAPALRIAYVPKQSMESGTSFEVPVYSSESRETLIFSLPAPLARDFAPETAVLNAVALFVAPSN